MIIADKVHCETSRFCSHLDVGSAEALPGDHVAVVVVRAAGVAVARLAAVRVGLGEAVVLGQTLVAVPRPRHVRFTRALSGLLVAAAAVVEGAEGAAGAQLATIRVLNSEVPVAWGDRDSQSSHHIMNESVKTLISDLIPTWFAVIASRPAHVGLAVALAGRGAELLAGALVAHTLVHLQPITAQ